VSEEEAEEIQEPVKDPMSQVKIRKVTVNVAVGSSGERLEKAVQVLETLTGQLPVRRAAKRSVREFGIREGEPIACMVTLRKDRAVSFLKRALDAVSSRVPASHFDNYGNFSFGISEHIEIPDTRYDPNLGIFGMDVSVVLEKRGRRVEYRLREPSKIGRNQRVSREEAQKFMVENFDVSIV